MAARGDNVDNEDIVIWHSFGLTHNPRIEGSSPHPLPTQTTHSHSASVDFPVMPVEIHQIHLKPADFFTRNPAIDVPSSKNMSSKLHTANITAAGAKGYTVIKDDTCAICTPQRNSQQLEAIRACCK